MRDVPDCNMDNKSVWGTEGNANFLSIPVVVTCCRPISPTQEAVVAIARIRKMAIAIIARLLLPVVREALPIILKNPLWYASRWGSYDSEPTAAAGGTKLAPDSVKSESKPDGYFPVYSPMISLRNSMRRLTRLTVENIPRMPSPVRIISSLTPVR